MLFLLLPRAKACELKTDGSGSRRLFGSGLKTPRGSKTAPVVSTSALTVVRRDVSLTADAKRIEL
jgi:hypothetical protein